MAKWQMCMHHPDEDPNVIAYDFTDSDLKTMLIVLQRASYDVRNNHEAEVVYALITACCHCQAFDDAKAEAELEVPF